ncbi:hypothetical protein RhiirA4_416330 [Rhizophagus irregularis]|uniref:Uncharacterized protein n=1 Tax=Rhizophagus irregularis TaxID=588596 RepID=A0A2I1G342_9GLOM|nr:hypothetical protein RhiirA4_416330 [Rhizophagus irregularis]
MAGLHYKRMGCFYRQKWIIASLNKHMSKIDNETWVTSPNNTNTAEAAHALAIVVIRKNLPLFMYTKNTMCQIEDVIGLIIHNVLSNKRQDEVKCNNNGNDKENNITKSLSKSDELEYQERTLALKERELDLKEREAKVRIMELSNIEKERELNLNS